MLMKAASAKRRTVDATDNTSMEMSSPDRDLPVDEVSVAATKGGDGRSQLRSGDGRSRSRSRSDSQPRHRGRDRRDGSRSDHGDRERGDRGDRSRRRRRSRSRSSERRSRHSRRRHPSRSPSPYDRSARQHRRSSREPSPPERERSPRGKDKTRRPVRVSPSKEEESASASFDVPGKLLDSAGYVPTASKEALENIDDDNQDLSDLLTRLSEYSRKTNAAKVTQNIQPVVESRALQKADDYDRGHREHRDGGVNAVAGETSKQLLELQESGDRRRQVPVSSKEPAKPAVDIQEETRQVSGGTVGTGSSSSTSRLDAILEAMKTKHGGPEDSSIIQLLLEEKKRRREEEEKQKKMMSILTTLVVKQRGTESAEGSQATSSDVAARQQPSTSYGPKSDAPANQYEGAPPAKHPRYDSVQTSGSLRGQQQPEGSVGQASSQQSSNLKMLHQYLLKQTEAASGRGPPASASPASASSSHRVAAEGTAGREPSRPSKKDELISSVLMSIREKQNRK